MSVILRVDDFPHVKDDEMWKHNLENFKKFDAVIEKHGITRYVLGVIPSHTTREMIEWLAENPRIEVALHGIEHDERFPNEFREWETEDDIYKKIVSAKEPLRECNGSGEVTVYIPPHNVIDMKTARALSRAGFRNIMCGPGTDMDVFHQIKYSRLFPMHTPQYSRHPKFYGRTDEMLDRDNSVPDILKEVDWTSTTVVTLHWTWEWNIGLDSLNRFLEQTASAFK